MVRYSLCLFLSKLMLEWTQPVAALLQAAMHDKMQMQTMLHRNALTDAAKCLHCCLICSCTALNG